MLLPYVYNRIWCSAVQHKEGEFEGNLLTRERRLPPCRAPCYPYASIGVSGSSTRQMSYFPPESSSSSRW